MTTETNVTSSSRETKSSKKTTQMVIVDFGNKRRKQIQRLLKGEGALADDILETVDELKRKGEIPGECDRPVVVVVRERPSESSMRTW